MNKKLCQIKSDNGFLDYSSSTPILKGISKEKKEKREKNLLWKMKWPNYSFIGNKQMKKMVHLNLWKHEMMDIWSLWK